MLTQLWPAAGDAAPIDPFTDAGLATLQADYAPPRPDWFRINLVTSVTGSAAGADGTSETLTNRVDRRILGILRRHAELVLVGAQSVRAEGYRAPRTAHLGIVTGSGDLRGHRIEAAAAERIVILCPAAARATAAAALPGAGIVVVPDTSGRMSASEILAAIHALGPRSIVCEGGPLLAAQFAAADLVDELCLTTAPRLTATTLPALGGAPFPPVPVRLDRLLADEASTLYARWRREADSPAAGSAASQSPIADA